MRLVNGVLPNGVAARARTLALLLVAGALLAGCRPDLGEPGSLVTEARFLALRAEPPEALPGGMVQLRALVASPTGSRAEPRPEWAFCTAPKPLDENNVVSGDCLDGAAAPLATEPTPTLRLPVDACQLFGPDPPPQRPGQPPLRPRDPDVTGGYYQPIRVRLDRATAIALERVTCNLAGAPAELASAFTSRYRPNQNPRLLGVEATAAGRPLGLDAVPAGAAVELEASWDAVDAESYPVFDVAAQALVDRRESLRVSWFGTAGSFAHERTGRTEADPESTSANTWTAPAAPGAAWLWVVLRDSRGGVDFRELFVVVR